jgi:hypothetical protein
MTNNAKIPARVTLGTAVLMGFLVSLGSLAAVPVGGDGNPDLDNVQLGRPLQMVAEETQPEGGGEKKGKKGKKGSEGDPSATDERFLSVEQLSNLFPDTEISHVNPVSASNVYMIFRADGTLTGTTTRTNARVSPLSGDWSVTPKGTLCFSSEQEGQHCFYLARRGDRQLIRYSNLKKPMAGIDWTIVKPGPRAHLVLE